MLPAPNQSVPSADPHGPPDPAWEEAFLRVESYLRAHHVESRMLLNRLVTEIIAAARARAALRPAEAPVAAALHVTHARIGAWFAQAGIPGDGADERVRARCRLALVLADLPGHRVPFFLSAAEVPPAIGAALRAGVLHPGPGVSFTNMAAAPLEFGFERPPDAAVPRRHLARAAVGWLAAGAVLTTLWFSSR